ncbi:MAG: hypothetical protein U0525_06460, partial [Patescibacteria group bacterium]
MRYFYVLISIVSLFVFFNAQDVKAADRYAQCDSCGLCRNTKRTDDEAAAGTNKIVYQQPQNWGTCLKCLYPTPEAEGALGCPAEFLVEGLDGTPVPSANCKTIKLDDTDQLVKPEKGRMYSDIGCFSTGIEGFMSPDASVDVVKKLLDLVTSVTGAVGLIYILISAGRLLASQGNPESIRAGRKML